MTCSALRRPDLVGFNSMWMGSVKNSEEFPEREPGLFVPESAHARIRSARKE